MNTVTIKHIQPGTKLHATDRDYVVTLNGSWKRTTPKRHFNRRASQSNIYLAHPPGTKPQAARHRTVGDIPLSNIRMTPVDLAA